MDFSGARKAEIRFDAGIQRLRSSGRSIPLNAASTRPVEYCGEAEPNQEASRQNEGRSGQSRHRRAGLSTTARLDTLLVRLFPEVTQARSANAVRMASVAFQASRRDPRNVEGTVP